MGDTDIKRISRLTAIVTQLQTRSLLTAVCLSQKFNVSLRTIYRDIRTLEQAGVPVITVDGKGYKLMDGYKVPPVMFTEDEANALVTLERLAHASSDTSLSKEYASALGKVKSILRHPVKEKAELLSERIAVSPMLLGGAVSNTLLLIQHALTSFEALQIIYHAQHNDAETERVVEPFALYYSLQESWLLIAYCRLRKDFRMFRLDRLLHIKPSGLFFQPHKLTLAQFLDKKRKNFQTPDIPLS